MTIIALLFYVIVYMVPTASAYEKGLPERQQIAIINFCCLFTVFIHPIVAVVFWICLAIRARETPTQTKNRKKQEALEQERNEINILNNKTK